MTAPIRLLPFAADATAAPQAGGRYPIMGPHDPTAFQQALIARYAMEQARRGELARMLINLAVDATPVVGDLKSVAQGLMDLWAGRTVQGMAGLAGALPFVLGKIGPVYHRSPNDFDAFNLSKAGGGHGRQDYGKGHYFTNTPKALDKYVTDSPTAFDYTVELDAEPEDFIQWTKPLRDQPPAVQSAVRELMPPQPFHKDGLVIRKLNAEGKYAVVDERSGDWADQVFPSRADAEQAIAQQALTMTPYFDSDLGSRIYERLLERYGNDRDEVMAVLRQRGVKGVTYPDYLTNGATNYVVFGDDVPRVTNKVRVR